MNIIFIIILIVLIYLVYNYSKTNDQPIVVDNSEVILVDESIPVISYYRDYDNVPSFRGMVRDYYHRHIHHEGGGSKRYRDHHAPENKSNNVSHHYNKRYESYRKDKLREKLENVSARPQCNAIHFN